MDIVNAPGQTDEQSRLGARRFDFLGNFDCSPRERARRLPPTWRAESIWSRMLPVAGIATPPKNEKGEPIAGKELRGAPLSFKPIAPVPDWADKAPNIAGLRAWETADAVKFLMTGIAYNDLPPRPAHAAISHE